MDAHTHIYIYLLSALQCCWLLFYAAFQDHQFYYTELLAVRLMLSLVCLGYHHIWSSRGYVSAASFQDGTERCGMDFNVLQKFKFILMSRRQWSHNIVPWHCLRYPLSVIFSVIRPLVRVSGWWQLVWSHKSVWMSWYKRNLDVHFYRMTHP